MEQTSPAAGSTSSIFADAVGPLTDVHLAWIVLFAILVVVAILYGVRRKRRLDAAQREVVEHAEEAGVETPAPDADEASATEPAVAGEAAAPAVVEPAPPAEPEPAPASAATITAAAPTGEDPADGPVTQLKGLGPKVTARLAELGIASVGQIAALDHDAAQRLDAQLGPFKGRMERDRWVEQARFLAAGDRAGFEAVFGKL